MPVETLNHILATLTLISLASVVLLLSTKVRDLVAKKGILIGFVVALGAMLTSLYYSEIVGYEPCVLCWYQRIFLYPEALILGVALYKREASIRLYSLVLSALGGLIALYHVFLEQGITAGIPCPATGPSCLTRYVFEYGFVTIPVMSLTAFILIFLAVYFSAKPSNN